MSPNWLRGIYASALRMGLDAVEIDLGPIWEELEHDRVGVSERFAKSLQDQNVGAVLSYLCNGATNFQCFETADGRPISMFEALGIPHLMLWSDHPQWAVDKFAIQPAVQPLLRSPNNFHFFKSEAAALENADLLGWRNCSCLDVAEDPEAIAPVEYVDPPFDVVALVGHGPRFDPRLERWLDHPSPDVQAIAGVVAEGVREQLDGLWRREAPGLHDKLMALSEDWIDCRRSDHRKAAYRYFVELESVHADGCRILREHPQIYFAAAAMLWEFGEWQRTFVLAYLARRFRVAVYGGDWSGLGIDGGGWVDHAEHGVGYAQGKVAINVTAGHDEEGLTHKIFEMAASGVAILHNRQERLSDCFEVGREVMDFETPGEACERVGELLANAEKRKEIARAGNERLRRDHNWEKRLKLMLTRANL